MCCGAASLAMRAKDIDRLETIEMRMLRMICKKTLKDKIRSKCIRVITGVGSITEVMRSQQLRWHGHVEKMTLKVKH